MHPGAEGARARLSALMFLEYFVWGSWTVTLATYVGRTLAFSGVEIGLLYTTGAIAAIVSPFFVGTLADRFFATERMLALLHLLGGGLLWAASSTTRFAPLYLVLLGYAILFMPTLALCISISFDHLPEPGSDFPRVRVLGTAGWIAAGVLVGQLRLEATPLPLRIAAISSLALAAFCLTLPHTPPHAAEARAAMRGLVGRDVLRLLRDPAFAVFMAGAFLIAVPAQFYAAFMNLYLNEVGVRAAATRMTLGQASEGTFMLLLPWLLPRLGVKWLLLAGMAGWVVRYALLALNGPGAMEPLLYGAILLHGLCYGCFFLTAQIYVAERADVRIRAAAQGFFTLAALGVGSLLGSWAAGSAVDAFALPAAAAGHDWRSIWLIPAAAALVVTVLFAFAFRPGPSPRPVTAFPAPD